MAGTTTADGRREVDARRDGACGDTRRPDQSHCELCDDERVGVDGRCLVWATGLGVVLWGLIFLVGWLLSEAWR